MGDYKRNEVIITGFVQHYAVRSGQGKPPFSSFSLSYGHKGAQAWVDVVAYEEVHEYAADHGAGDGTMVEVRGKLSTRKYSPANGPAQYRTQIVAAEIRVLRAAKAAADENQTQPEIDQDFS